MGKSLCFIFLSTACLGMATVNAQNWVNGGNTLAANGTLGTNSSHSLIFETSGADRGRITNGGNWAIGSTGTTSKLTVNSAANVSPFRAQIAGITKLIVNGNGGVSIGSVTAGPANGLYVAGIVSIGTATPTSKLHVVGGGISIQGNSSTGTGVMGTGATFGLYGTGTGTSSYGVYGTSKTYGVYGTSPAYGVYGAGETYAVWGKSSGGWGVYGQSNSSIGVGGTSGSHYGVYGNSGYIGVRGNSINSGGYGVYGTANTSATSNGGYGVYGNGYIGVYGTGISTGVFGSSSSYGVYASGGSFGVYGKGSPYGVFGSGSSYGVFGSSSFYAGYFDGKVHATGGYSGPSDRKLKQNITELSSAIDIINKLQPKAYEYRQDGNYQLMNLPKGKHFGLIAQDLEEILPDLVHEAQFNTAIAQSKEVNPKAIQVNAVTLPSEMEESKGEVIDYKAVNYMELIPILVKGMQEQQQVINNQQQLTEQQQQQMNKLQNELTDLKLLVLKLTGQNINTPLSSTHLSEAMPNPVKGSSTIQYAIPEGSTRAQLLITDALGRQIKTIQLSASGVINVDVTSLASGVYNYSLIVDNKTVVTRKMTVVK